ncbi:MAG: hypothetical protein ACD_75C02370G0003, partial [uncultured bacterium]
MASVLHLLQFCIVTLQQGEQAVVFQVFGKFLQHRADDSILPPDCFHYCQSAGRIQFKHG